ncbi:hypothetical protein H744_2c0240 [Photobacterium gaetbulicola Gung47]|uniref:Uncharacterized protein n=1 Tax=Photobacterium gaetbulicola Gung47 TaxID=658445 RepID=A0A0C5WIN3_9GAMM|nr:hypothetical protein H744_2c0240 [Photobacterium gaetbulicola Gung47]
MGGNISIGHHLLGLLAAALGDNRGNMREELGLVAARLRLGAVISRQQIWAIRFHHQAVIRDITDDLTQLGATALITDPPGDTDVQILRQTVAQLLTCSGETVQYRRRKLIPPWSEDRHKALMGIAAMHEHRHVQLSGQCQLGLEHRFLLRARGKVTVKIKPTFTDRHHFGLSGQLSDFWQGQILDALCIMRMNPCCTIGIARPLTSHRQGLLAFFDTGTGKNQAVDTRRFGTCHDLFTVFVKPAVGQVYPDINHRCPHSFYKQWEQLNESRYVWLSPFVNFRVEYIPQPVPQQVDHQYQGDQYQSREGGDPPGAREDIVKANADQRAQRRLVNR